MHPLKLILVYAALATMLALSACGKPKLSSLGSDAVILAFGDSLTAGKGTSKDTSYPAALAQLSGREVINAGVSGETTEQGLRRLPDILDETDPHLMVLMHGGNDILRNLGAGQAKANLNSMINMAKERDIQVVLVGIPEKKLLSSSAPYYKELAEEHELVLEKSIISSLLKKPALKSDSVHFNAAGYGEIAHTMYDLLKDRGAL